MVQMWLLKSSEGWVRITVLSETCPCVGPFEMDLAPVYLRNYLRQGGCVVSSICFLSVCLLARQTLLNRF